VFYCLFHLPRQKNVIVRSTFFCKRCQSYGCATITVKKSFLPKPALPIGIFRISARNCCQNLIGQRTPYQSVVSKIVVSELHRKGSTKERQVFIETGWRCCSLPCSNRPHRISWFAAQGRRRFQNHGKNSSRDVGQDLVELDMLRPVRMDPDRSCRSHQPFF